MPFSTTDVLSRIDAEFDASVRRLETLLRIKSISTDPAYAADVREAADWIAGELGSIGFEATVHSTDGHPMLVAHHPGPGGDVPHVLYYAHYDVQPPDPLDEWRTGPFEPTIEPSDHGEGGRIVARGAVDDKGQLMTFVEAFRAWQAVHGTVPVRVTVLLEGEEESGSPSFEPFVSEHVDELRADACIICDTGMWDIETPAITYMLRGLVYLEVTLVGPAHDLHSGMYGGAVVNPATALARVIAGLHDDDGVVQVSGFYDDVVPLDEKQREQWRGLGFDEAGFLGHAGCVPFGEAGYSTLERTWARPTCEINGIIGGYTGDGAKTVIGAMARAKVSCRLVANQDPRKIHDALVRFFEERTPPGCRWEFETHGVGEPIRVPTDSPFLEAVVSGLGEIYDRDTVLIGTGGSIPAAATMQQLLGLDPLLVGFGLDDDRVHSPNEKFELECLRNGIKSHAAIMARIAAIDV